MLDYIKYHLSQTIVQSREQSRFLYNDGDFMFYHTTFLNREGVYLLGDFYVGYSKNIKKRINGHANSGQSSVLMGIYNWSVRKKKKRRDDNVLIPVFFLSDKKHMERPFARIFSKEIFPDTIENTVSRCHRKKDSFEKDVESARKFLMKPLTSYYD